MQVLNIGNLERLRKDSYLYSNIETFQADADDRAV